MLKNTEQASSTPPPNKTSQNRGIRPERDRWFESVFLRRRVLSQQLAVMALLTIGPTRALQLGKLCKKQRAMRVI
jgi:hypothetical protein